MSKKLLTFFLLFSLLLSGCAESGGSAHTSYLEKGMDDLLKDTRIYKYGPSDYEFILTSTSGDGRYSYDARFVTNGSLSSLDKEDILTIAVEMRKKLFSATSRIDCGKEMKCDLRHVTFVDGDNEYQVEWVHGDKVTINGEEYDGPEQEYVFRSSSFSNNDEETYVDGKFGYDWITLTSNQKFHAISNAMYSLSNNGYLILETEQFYIDALDNYFSGTSELNSPVAQVLAEIGIMTGTMSK